MAERKDAVKNVFQFVFTYISKKESEGLMSMNTKVDEMDAAGCGMKG